MGMSKQAKSVFVMGKKTIDEYAYGYECPGDPGNDWKSRLKYMAPAGDETARSRYKDDMAHSRAHGGRRLLSDPFPRLIIKDGPKRTISDYEPILGGIPLVSNAFRLLVESIEPGVHQFEPLTVNWKDGSHAADMYLFIICKALDSIAADHVEGVREKYELDDGRTLLGPWKAPNGFALKRPVFDLSIVGDVCLWQDEFFITFPNQSCCSDVFKDAYDASGLVGAAFGPRGAV